MAPQTDAPEAPCRRKAPYVARRWIESENFTQAQAAKRLGIAQPRVFEIVRGKIELMSLDYLVGLCAKAGVSVEVRLAA